MMKWLFGIMIAVAVITGLLNGNISDVSDAALNDSVNAVELSIYMIGGMCVWGGVMRVAEKAGLTEKLCRLFRIPAKILFKGLSVSSHAFEAICLNITANLLGLGNAATPFGIDAMKSLEVEDGCDDTASDNMIVFTVLNTSSITLIPTTVASLRLKHGSAEPLDILAGILITSAISVTVAVTTALVLNSIKRGKK